MTIGAEKPMKSCLMFISIQRKLEVSGISALCMHGGFQVMAFSL